MNLGARLEGLTKHYGVWNCVGGAALEGISDVFALEIDQVVVKGHTRPTRVWTLIADKEPFDPALAEVERLMKAARIAFRNRSWADAEAHFRALSSLTVPGFDQSVLVQRYLARIAEYKISPPASDWDGSFFAMQK